VTPVDFFSGDLKRLESHHDFISAVCFKIKVEGNVTCRPDVELWHEGKRVDIQKYGLSRDNTSDEISFTVRSLPIDKDDKVYYRATLGGMWRFGRIMEKPTTFHKPLKVAFGPVSLEKPIELKPGSNSAVVWAMGGGDGVDVTQLQADIDREVRGLPWAMILRLRVEPKQDP